ncbi:MAG: hypothetical protein JXR22_11125 [Prolixibacteraceae bacterium]|nr:hypothetical protein [Prolixibacteraceae bacterium]
MEFETDRLFHIFNRGNNRQTVFFNRDNYLFFLEKIKQHILPYGNILAWCLIPNHFHLMVEVNRVSITIAVGKDSHGVTSSHPVTKIRTLNESIAIMLRSYTRAIQKQENRTGSLFQMSTKAICLNDPKLEPAYFNAAFGTVINRTINDLEYPQLCFDYIHRNPLHHRLVKNLCEWEFSSYPDYYCSRQGKLINKQRAVDLGLVTG